MENQETNNNVKALAKSKYQVMASITCELMWLKYLLDDLQLARALITCQTIL